MNTDKTHTSSLKSFDELNSDSIVGTILTERSHKDTASDVGYDLGFKKKGVVSDSGAEEAENFEENVEEKEEFTQNVEEKCEPNKKSKKDKVNNYNESFKQTMKTKNTQSSFDAICSKI